MEIVVHSKKSVSTKVSKEIVPFQQEFPILECDSKNDPIGHPESDKKIRLHSKTSDSATLTSWRILKIVTPYFYVRLDTRVTQKNGHQQWRTQKIVMGVVSHSGIWWSFLFGVPCLWRHNLTSYWCFQTNVFAKFVDTICMFFYTHSP